MATPAYWCSSQRKRERRLSFFLGFQCTPTRAHTLSEILNLWNFPQERKTEHCVDLTRSQRRQAHPVSSKTQGQQSLFLIFSFTLYHTSSSAMCLRPLGQGRMETGKRCATSIPMCQTIAGTQLNGNQKRLFCLIQFLLPEYRAIPRPEMKLGGWGRDGVRGQAGRVASATRVPRQSPPLLGC